MENLPSEKSNSLWVILPLLLKILSNEIVQIIHSSVIDDEKLSNSLRQIISIAYQKNPSCKTLLMRSFRAACLRAINGSDMDLFSEDFGANILEKREERPPSSIDNAFIISIAKKSKL